VGKSPRKDYETPALVPFELVLRELGMNADGRGQGWNNRFDPGFGLDKNQQYQYGDLRKDLPDRLVIVEVESGGGLSHLIQYWPLSVQRTTPPILLLHVYGGVGSKNNYISATKLWDFTWQRIRPLLWAEKEPLFFARKYEYTEADDSGLKEAAAAYRRCLSEPLPVICREIFGYPSQ
jgi:hypothetical protein